MPFLIYSQYRILKSLLFDQLWPVIYKILSSLAALAGCFNTILGWKYFWIQLSSAGCPNIIYYAFLELIILIFAVVDEDKSTGWTPFIGKDPT